MVESTILAVLTELGSIGVIFGVGFKFFARGIDRHLSLVNIHLILWTGIIAGSYLALSIANQFVPINIGENGNSMVFVAIATGTMAGSSLIRSGQSSTPPSSSSNMRPKRQQVFGSENKPENYSVAKLQMSAWNGIAMILFLIQVYYMFAGSQPIHFPDLGTTLTYIIGISNGIYLANKTGDKPSPTSVQNNGTPKITNPGTVAEQVLGPGGYRSKSWVHQITPGNIVRAMNGNMQEITPDGTVVSDIGPIPPRRVGKTFPGILTNIKARLPDSADGWQTYSIWDNTTGSPISYFTTTWVVPKPPQLQEGQTNFIFNGLTNDANFILQPVLAWGPMASSNVGGNYWYIVSAYVDNDGHAVYSQAVQVYPGNTLTGVMSCEKDNGDGTFNYTCYFNLNNSKIPNTILPIQNVPELKTACETLESWGVQQPHDYPNADSTPMTKINITTGISNRVDQPIVWIPYNALPNSRVNVTVTEPVASDGTVVLNYNGT